VAHHSAIELWTGERFVAEVRRAAADMQAAISALFLTTARSSRSDE
jgi:hypothetical protein